MSEKTAPLCWGQRYHWLRHHLVPPGARHDAHIVANCPLPAGVSVSHLTAVLAYLVRRHETLRTVFDVDDHGRPRQRVLPPAAPPLHTATVEADGTPAPAEVIRELTIRDFDPAREPPLRACLVTAGGTPRSLVVVLNHIAFDDWGLETFRHEFQAVLEAVTTRRRAALAPVAHQPWDLARHEAARPAAETRATLRHWEREVAGQPADGFARRRMHAASANQTEQHQGAANQEADGPAPRDAPAHSAALTSPTLLAAARDIAGRHRVWPSAVHLAAFAIAMAAYTEEETVVAKWFTSHRGPSGHESVLTCMFSPTLVSVGLGGDPRFGEVVRRMSQRLEEGQDHAYLPYDELVELLAREGARRGQLMCLGTEINFLSHAEKSCGTRRERYARHPIPEAWAQSETDCYFRVYEWQDGVTLSLQALSSVMDAEVVERFLRGYAKLLDTAHRDPAWDPRFSELADLFGFAPAPTPASSAPDGPVPLCQPPTSTDPGTVAKAELALVEAVAETNGLDSVDTAQCYIVTGGRVLRAPHVVTVLAKRGWTGVTVSDLIGIRPLRELATQLTAQ